MRAQGALDNKVAIVTGAGSGIGAGSAVALAGAGAAVVVNDINTEAAGETVDRITAAGGVAMADGGDVSLTADVKAMIQRAVDSYGGLDVLHANAGVERYVDLEAMSEQDMDLLLDVDLKGVLLCAQYSIAPMRARGGGSMIFTSSVQASHSLPGCVVYAAAKAGVVAAARSLTLEVGRDNIRVNAISPGTIDTPMLTRDLEDMNVEEADNFMDRVHAANTLGRVGTVEEVGALVVFLASDASSYISSVNIAIDAGFTAVKAF
ncbi:MAG: SDR family oxidoreductase [bacterium]|nr:SDR family oxidoreductase [bacterium]MXZ30693.1 SDR family oxidoreductase [Acidimicrobiia bacterium]MYB23535.1 SDR family oxidoreductase [Acidimicrobiia bacterium]MYJ13451.1 SDR family oxidoreductase [Acidimicrobiia bacterium]